MKRIVVDPLMLKAIENNVPRLEIATGHPFIPAGVPIHIDGWLLPCIGYIEHHDGRIEKFGNWPKVEANKK